MPAVQRLRRHTNEGDQKGELGPKAWNRPGIINSEPFGRPHCRLRRSGPAYREVIRFTGGFMQKMAIHKTSDLLMICGSRLKLCSAKPSKKTKRSYCGPRRDTSSAKVPRTRLGNRLSAGCLSGSIRPQSEPRVCPRRKSTPQSMRQSITYATTVNENHSGYYGPDSNKR